MFQASLDEDLILKKFQQDQCNVLWIFNMAVISAYDCYQVAFLYWKLPVALIKWLFRHFQNQWSLGSCITIYRYPKSGSFVRPTKVSSGMTLEAAVRGRYQDDPTIETHVGSLHEIIIYFWLMLLCKMDSFRCVEWGISFVLIILYIFYRWLICCKRQSMQDL